MRSLLKKKNERKASAAPKGTLIGYASHENQPTPFRLSLEHLRGHSLMLGNLGVGKTTLMRHLVNVAIQSGAALIVLDEEGDLVPDVLTHVPRQRAQDVTWIDLSHPSIIPGWNVLDVSEGDTSDLIIAELMQTATELWGPYWSARTEDALRLGLVTLLSANRILAQKNEAQFTLLDLPPLFELPNFRHRTLQSFVSNLDVISWWSEYFERLSQSMVTDLMAALLIPLRQLSFNQTTRNLLGQSESTLKLGDLLKPGRITLIDTSGLAMTPDLRHWLTTIMTGQITRMAGVKKHASPNTSEPSIIVALNGAIPTAYAEEPDWLSHLRKYGVSLILSSGSLDHLKSDYPGLSQTLLANTANLFAFRTGYSDAEMLSIEFGKSISARDLMQLPDHICYARTCGRNVEPGMERIETLAPAQGDDQVRQELLEQIKPCGRNVAEVETERTSFMAKWYGRERALLTQLIREHSEKIKPSQRDRFANP
ncbi:MAG: type IV secretion system DNA-binding domain-containing protein [Chloroflexi bacterium]|nr:type IV secretion system DNA-binding domain-containing protein [Chloroflexota bacterium]